MEKITTIGLDVAKQVFLRSTGSMALMLSLSVASFAAMMSLGVFKALPPCLIGIEACATGHH